MKNIFFVIVLVILFNQSFGQNHLRNKNERHPFLFNTPFTKSSQTYNKTSISDWYSPIVYAALDSVIGNYLSYNIGLLQNDSIAKIVYADGSIDHNSWLSVGRVLDPKDTIINLTINPQQRLSPYSNYTVDSIRFTYAYVRNADSVLYGGTRFLVTDTLFISYFAGNEIQKYSFANTLNKYALVNWNGDSFNRMPTNYLSVDTILLTDNDSTGIANIGIGFENFIHLKSFAHKIPTSIYVDANNGGNADNLIAYTLTFKSGIQTVIGTDTAMMLYQKDPSTIPSGTRRTNYFGFRYALNTDTISWQNPVYYNTSLLAPWWCAYAVTDDWYGFVSGNAYTNEYFIDADFHLSSLNAGINETKNIDFVLSTVFPNPVKFGNNVSINFNLKSNSEIRIEVYNMVGQLVKTFPTQKYNVGENAANINTAGLNEGLYFVNFSVNGVTQTKKLSIID